MMKKLSSLLLAIVVLCSLTSCGAAAQSGSTTTNAADTKAAYEYMLTSETSITSSRFDFEFKVPEGYTVLTDDMIVAYGNCSESDVIAGTCNKDGTEYKLHKTAMAMNYVNNQFITFTVNPLQNGATLQDFYNSVVSAVAGTSSTVSEMTSATVNGMEAATFQMEQKADPSTGDASDHFNVIYIVKNGDFLLMLNCSGSSAYPVDAVAVLSDQLKIS